MRILFSILLAFMLLPAMTGCTPKKQDTTTNKKTTEGTKNEVNQDLKLSFNEFDLRANFQDTKKDYEADYKHKKASEKPEAKLDDSKTNEKLAGDEAINKLAPLLQQLKFDKDTKDEDVINQVVDVFQLDKDYEKFDLKVVFTDGTKKEYKVPK
ncbi:YusW family protein [Bacillus cereus group sp. BfR-BA-01380]|uniref:YusW family protein n=1 Tax=Bacillus cereus group sp. BfR-BA-01380 TaxID=2920324 RepID=UPI001F566050|nr:YusW family protein [Bacillus cereus group sp. BfR-BA-01380]